MEFNLRNLFGGGVTLRTRLSQLAAASILIIGIGALIWAAVSGKLDFFAATGQTIVLSPASTTVTVNETFPVTIQVNTNNLNTVVASVELTYNTADLSLESFTPTGDVTSGSVYQYNIEAVHTPASGTLQMTRGDPGDGQTNDSDDGFTGQNGTFATLTFRALRPVASTTITIVRANSALVADDGNGTDELDSVNNASVIINGVTTPTVSVGLTATPDNGTAPLNDVDLAADVSGTATGTIRYRFDCTNDGTYEHDVSNSTDPYTASNVCDYAAAGTYTARVRADREGVFDEDTRTITVTAPSSTVTITSFTASPNSGIAPVNDVDFTVDVDGVVSDITRFRIDCTNNGSYESDATSASDPYTVANVCDYAAAGTYTASARVDRGTAFATATTTITVNAAPTLSVTLSATPSSGTAPLNSVDLIANVSGTATGNIRYRFDCTNNGTYERDVTNTSDPYTATDLCSYTNAGTYTARVVADRGGLSANATTTITVTTSTPPPPSPPPSPPAATGCSPSQNADDYHYVWVRQNGYPTLDWGQNYRFEITLRNTGRGRWCRGVVSLGTDRARDRIPGFIREGAGPSGWLTPNRIELVQASVDPGQEGTFVFWMTVPRGKSPGTYREYFRLVADGITWMEDYGIYWDVLVPTLADLYHAGYVSQNGYPTLRRGQSYMFELRLRNTGLKTWERGIVNLGTDRPRDVVWNWIRDGGQPTGWLNNNRIYLVEQSVAPGAVGTFRFWYTVPDNKPFGTYRDYFRPVADGITWMDDYGIYWDVTVVP